MARGHRLGVLDLSGAYRRAFEAALPQVRQVADPFHVVRLANGCIDEVRRRAQNDTLDAPGRKDDPQYRARRLLIAAHERLSERGDARLRGLLAAGDPHGEVRLPWHAKETLRGFYDIDCPQLAERYAAELADRSGPPEPRRLGRTLTRWHTHIVNWHHARVSNGPTEAINNAHQTRRLRIPPLRPLPNPSPPLRRQTQLESPRHPHSPLISEEPLSCDR